MIGISGQYLITFKINEIEDFIKESQLVIFRLIEEAGNILPIFELIFDSHDDTIIQYLNQNNDIEVSFGVDINSLTNIRLKIFSRDKISRSSISTRIRITGLLSMFPYAYTCKTNIYNNDSVSVIKSIAGKSFKVVSNIDSADDKMSWVQSNIPDRQFINNVWLHSKLKTKDLLVVGITCQNSFIINSLRNSLISKKPTWKFQNVAEASNDIIYSGTPRFIGSPGMTNHITGFPKSRIIHDIDSNKSVLNTPKITPILARTSKMDSVDVGNRLQSVSIKNSNIHDDYHDIYDINVARLNSLQGLSAKVNINNMYFPIKILDTVMLKDVSGSTEYLTSEEASGFWIVTKIARIVSNRQFVNIITLSRDGINNVR